MLKESKGLRTILAPATGRQFGSSPLVGLLLVAALALGLRRRRPVPRAA